MCEVTTLTVFHDDVEQFLLLVEMVLVYSDEVGVGELLHDVDFPLCLLGVERVDFDLFVSKLLALVIEHEVDRTKPALAYQLLNLILLHRLYHLIRQPINLIFHLASDILSSSGSIH